MIRGGGVSPQFSVIVPARLGSTRLARKVLREIIDRPMIQWVWQRACASGAQRVIVATDDAEIANACRNFGADVEMTAPEIASGTDRVAAVAGARGFADSEIVLNVQGDEPGVDPEHIRVLAEAIHARPQYDMATPVVAMESIEGFIDPNCVKAARAADGRALYFSRAPIPWPRDAANGVDPVSFGHAWRHLGLYAFRSHALQRFAQLAPSALELTERLEQLRALENGMSIYLHPLPQSSSFGIDTEQDLQRFTAIARAAGSTSQAAGNARS